MVMLSRGYGLAGRHSDIRRAQEQQPTCACRRSLVLGRNHRLRTIATRRKSTFVINADGHCYYRAINSSFLMSLAMHVDNGRV